MFWRLIDRSIVMPIIGEYEYNEKDELGRGSFGVVYRGRRIKNGTENVAIKVLNLSNSSSENMQIVKREQNILQDLAQQSHPNLVTLLHCEQRDENLYFVMELCNGGDLAKYLKSKGHLDEVTIKQFLQQIVSGLKFLRQKNIIHRDLKLENILICFNGNGTTVQDVTLKIGDFGLGKYLSADARTSTFCGSPIYQAPEILETWKNNSTYNGCQVDMWSVGVIVYHLLMGNISELRDGNTMTLLPGTSRDLQDLLKGLLQKDPRNRFNLNRLSTHSFLGSPIHLSVNGPGGLKSLHPKDNSSVDHVIDLLSSTYGLDINESGIFLIVEDGRSIGSGSGGSIEDFGIKNGSQITFVHRLPGGKELKTSNRSLNSDFSRHHD